MEARVSLSEVKCCRLSECTVKELRAMASSTAIRRFNEKMASPFTGPPSGLVASIPLFFSLSITVKPEPMHVAASRKASAFYVSLWKKRAFFFLGLSLGLGLGLYIGLHFLWVLLTSGPFINPLIQRLIYLYSIIFIFKSRLLHFFIIF